MRREGTSAGAAYILEARLENGLRLSLMIVGVENQETRREKAHCVIPRRVANLARDFVPL